MSINHTKLSWKVLNWNVRGLNDKDKWVIIYDKIQESGCHIICFQETKRESIDLDFIRKFCPRRFDGFAFQPSVGRSGGILTVWDSAMLSGDCVFQDSFALSVDFKSAKDDGAWTLTNIYAPCQDAQQLAFISWFHNIQVDDDVDWLIVGDFNLIRAPTDRNKPGGNIHEILLFNEAISNLGLIEIPLKGRKFTWSNMQAAPFCRD
jgi:exonuclease III